MVLFLLMYRVGLLNKGADASIHIGHRMHLTLLRMTAHGARRMGTQPCIEASSAEQVKAAAWLCHVERQILTDATSMLLDERLLLGGQLEGRRRRKGDMHKAGTRTRTPHVSRHDLLFLPPPGRTKSTRS